MLTRQNVLSTPITDYTSTLPPGRRWERIALVTAGAPREDAIEAVSAIARRDGGRVVIYDAMAVSWATSPYPPGSGDWLPNLLGEAEMRRVGRDDLGTVARRLDEETLLGGIYLSPRNDVSDLSDLVQREGIDLVVCLLPSGDKRVRHVQRAGRHACLLLSPDGEEPRLIGSADPGDDLPDQNRVRWPYVVVVFVTFVLARLRNTL